ncbi:RagB/SusD family nutrient uptake outer membrane protein [Chryseobacterium sp.]|uniref:RagB/SusD family nutrient uptake outer membrane protein n=1 Tax=Chryseobacterium sp. TaxID=1871047 RepID=UPI00333F5C05
MKTILYIVLSTFILITFSSCEKQNEWLDAKRQKEMVIPETLKDFQAILDYFYSIHTAFPIFGQLGTDDFILTDADYSRSTEDIRNGYIWNKTIWSSDNTSCWDAPFAVILKSNVVLDGLKKVSKSPGDEALYNDVQGQAYFYRALFYYHLAQLFCKAYTSNSDSDPGLPIRLTSDVNVIAQRSSLTATYAQIISDAENAVTLLPQISDNNRRPSKAASLGLLAKIYLSMGNYDKAAFYADESLKINEKLLDYNSSYANLSRTYRFPANPYDHPEINFYGRGSGYAVVMPSSNTLGVINDELFNLYTDHDLRRSLFYFTNTLGLHKYRGSYTGTNSNFCGIATNEIYLIRAESYARMKKTDLALQDLNTLLTYRYETDYFTPLTISDPTDLLKTILIERRKELVGVSNIRWEDLKRLNTETAFEKTLTRTVNGQTYRLDPNSPRYVLPIPNNEIQLSHITQNER